MHASVGSGLFDKPRGLSSAIHTFGVFTHMPGQSDAVAADLPWQSTPRSTSSGGVNAVAKNDTTGRNSPTVYK